MPAPATPSPIDRLLGIMRQLRNPDGGCEWDLAQDFSTIAPYTIEEAYEVSDAIAGGDPAAIRDELGDLLLQVVFHSQIATDDVLFGFDDVANAISDKMERRDRKSTRLNSSHYCATRMPSAARTNTTYPTHHIVPPNTNHTSD